MDKPNIKLSLITDGFKLNALRFRIAIARIELSIIRVQNVILRNKNNLSHFRDVLIMITCVCVILSVFIMAFVTTIIRLP